MSVREYITYNLRVRLGRRAFSSGRLGWGDAELGWSFVIAWIVEGQAQVAERRDWLDAKLSDAFVK